MTLVVNITDWLMDGDFPAGSPRLRAERAPRRAIRRVRRAHPAASRARDAHRVQAPPWPRSLSRVAVVVKQNESPIQVHCPTCHEVEAVISGWDDKLWVDGLMEQVPMTDD